MRQETTRTRNKPYICKKALCPSTHWEPLLTWAARTGRAHRRPPDQGSLLLVSGSNKWIRAPVALPVTTRHGNEETTLPNTEHETPGQVSYKTHFKQQQNPTVTCSMLYHVFFGNGDVFIHWNKTGGREQEHGRSMGTAQNWYEPSCASAGLTLMKRLRQDLSEAEPPHGHPQDDHHSPHREVMN